MVFVGGGLGAVLREFLMQFTPKLADGFPLDILVANLVASFLLGLIAALYHRQLVSDQINSLVGTGIAGGLSTFSSFTFGTVVLLSESAPRAAVASVYVIVSLSVGYLAVILGMRAGRARDR